MHRRVAVPRHAATNSCTPEWVFGETYDLIDYGWVQYVGPLKGDKTNSIWLGISWDPCSRDRGRRTSGIWQDQLLFDAVTDSVSFVKETSLPPWSMSGISLIEAVGRRYGENAEANDHVAVSMANLKDKNLRTHFTEDGELVVPAESTLWARDETQMGRVNLIGGGTRLTEDILDLCMIGIQHSIVTRSMPDSAQHAAVYLSATSAVEKLWESVRQGRKFDHVRSLDVSGNALLSSVEELYNILQLFPSLRSLNLSSCRGLFTKFTEKSFETFDPAKVPDCLRVLAEVQLSELWGPCQLSKAYKEKVRSVNALKSFIQVCRNLRRLSLNSNALTTAEFTDIVPGMPPSLESLDIASNALVSLWDTLKLLKSRCPGLIELRMRSSPLEWPPQEITELRDCLGLATLSIDHCELRDWRAFLEVVVAFQRHLRVLRVWRNALFEKETQLSRSDSDKLRYLRWGMFPKLELCDGESITRCTRKEAELYVASLARGHERCIYFGESNSGHRELAAIAVSHLEELPVCDDTQTRNLQGARSNLIDKLKDEYGLKLRPDRIKSDVWEALEQFSGLTTVKIQHDGEVVLRLRVSPVYTTVGILKRFLDAKGCLQTTQSYGLCWSPLSAHDEAECGACVMLRRKYLPNSGSDRRVLTPTYNTLAFFGIAAHTEVVFEVVLGLETEVGAVYANALESSSGHGVLRRLEMNKECMPSRR